MDTTTTKKHYTMAEALRLQAGTLVRNSRDELVTVERVFQPTSSFTGLPVPLTVVIEGTRVADGRYTTMYHWEMTR